MKKLLAVGAILIVLLGVGLVLEMSLHATPFDDCIEHCALWAAETGGSFMACYDRWCDRLAPQTP